MRGARPGTDCAGAAAVQGLGPAPRDCAPLATGHLHGPRIIGRDTISGTEGNRDDLAPEAAGVYLEGDNFAWAQPGQREALDGLDEGNQSAIGGRVGVARSA